MTKKFSAALIAIQLIFLFLLFYVFFRIFNFTVVNNRFIFVFNPQLDLIFSFIALLVSLLLFYFISFKKFKYSYLWQFEAYKLILGTTKHKVRQAKEEPRIILLIFLEIIFSLFIAYSFYVAFDPDAEYFSSLINWDSLGFSPIVLLLMKILLFVFITGFILWLYNNTKQFRKTILSESPKDKLIKKIKRKDNRVN